MSKSKTFRFACFLVGVTLTLTASPVQSQAVGYDQPYRPQVHFSPREHWTNDPNGLVYFKGEYHLFFQYNPFGDHWGHMSWGHAVSTDLLHWHELPVAIPEKDGLMIFTGSVVVDHGNTSGLCVPGTECLVAIYTGSREPPQVHSQTQNIASSQDRGRTWVAYAGNPVLDLKMGDFRDPSVSWNEQAKQWIMAVSLPKEHVIQFYGSGDLKKWSHLSDFGPTGDIAGDWECPDLLQIPGSHKNESIWALKVGLNPGAPQGGSGEQYFLGSFDGKRFTPSGDPGSHGWTNYGKDDYCAISYNGLPKGQNPVLLGWMSNWQYAEKLPTAPWRGQMSLPRRLTFVKDEAGLALRQEPVITALHVDREPVLIRSGADLQGLTKSVTTTPYELDLRFEPNGNDLLGVRLFSDESHWTDIGFDRQKSEFYVDRTKSGATVAPGFAAKTVAPLIANRPYDLRVIVDRSSVETYAQNGTIAMTNLIFPISQDGRVELLTAAGKPVTVTGKVWKLQSIWK